MKFLKKQICFWVVPAADGRVRKVRLSMLSILLAAMLGTGVASCFLFIASDYVRVQSARARSFLHLKSLTAEREKLHKSKASLEEELSKLRVMNERASNYQAQVRNRMEELASILRSAEPLGVPAETLLPEDRTRTNSGDVEQGVGGAEIPCEGKHCGVMAEDGRAHMNPAVLGDPIPSHEDVIETIDRYIEALRFFPVGIPVNSHITSGFGIRRSPFHRGTMGMHEGIDFNMPHGSIIVASADGVVRDVRRCPTYGLLVDVAHSGRVVTRYAHLSKTFVSPGERICRSEIIGLVGSTGRSTGPHLHYEVLIDGRAVNPMKLIQLAKQMNVFLG